MSGKSSPSAWEHFFKPEVRRSGAALVAKGAVVLQLGSDTQVDAYAKGTSVARISFRAESIESSQFSVDCSCTASGKGQLCKHIWATLLLLIAKSSDFLAAKTHFDKIVHENKTSLSTSKPVSDSTSQMDFKQKQADYRKQAYEIQKQRAKDYKRSRSPQSEKEAVKAARQAAALPSHVQTALQYFAENGFPMNVPVDEESIGNAKRVLSRVFHPDKGGSHEEIVELLRHANALLEFQGG